MKKNHLPIIGISADFAEGDRKTKLEPTLFLAQRYYRAVEQAGALPIILPQLSSATMIRQALDRLDGLIVSGGGFDIHPSYYGEKPLKQLGMIKTERTEFELTIAAAALKQDLPLLGICGGEQALNVVLGGSLYQDIGAQVANAMNHEQSEKKSYGGHSVTIASGTRLSAIVQHRRIEVNTTHHQAVKRLGKGLIANAVADDGIVEAIESTRHRFAIGVQWHPEVLAPRRIDQRRIFAAFVTAAKRTV
ncbi:MAG: gamma-glutamyl-gamma-aminobutyrate hydrolase family protein [Deltaproteobacteria bacterium]|nr:gamma-glutamyl-gamma-aminobutyrate hydrolase family protein [Deltaproteobacteria bacterium]